MLTNVPLFHLSNKKGLTVLTKRISDSWGDEKEDHTIQRVCFSTEIDGCFSAICPIVGKNMYVYVPKFQIPKEFLHKPTLKQVFDSKMTKEVWSLIDTPVECIGIVKAESYNLFHYKNYIKSFGYFKYKWHWVEKYN